MKNCSARHELVLFTADRCPVCAVIDRLDKQLLAADVRIAELEKRLIPNPVWVDWNGGHA